MRRIRNKQEFSYITFLRHLNAFLLIREITLYFHHSALVPTETLSSSSRAQEASFSRLRLAQKGFF